MLPPLRATAGLALLLLLSPFVASQREMPAGGGGGGIDPPLSGPVAAPQAPGASILGGGGGNNVPPLPSLATLARSPWRTPSASAGGEGGGISPPLGSLVRVAPGAPPTLATLGPVVVLVIGAAETARGPHGPRLAVLRRGAVIVAVRPLADASPTVLMVPAGEGLVLDLPGSDALGIPLTAGSTSLVIVP